MDGEVMAPMPDSPQHPLLMANFVPPKLFKQIYQHFLAFNFMCVCPFAMAGCMIEHFAWYLELPAFMHLVIQKAG